MNKHIEAIERVIARRLDRGASVESLNGYKQQLIAGTWKNNPTMIAAIEGIEI